MRSLPPNIHEHQHASIPPPPALMLLPALSTFPILRDPMGYDIVYPTKTLPPVLLPGIMGFALTVISEPARIGAAWFYLFLVVSFAVSLVKFGRRALGQRRGEEIHTYEAGYSILTRLLPLPIPVTEQLLTPLALGLTGYIIATTGLSLMLGWWLVIAAFSYLLMSRWEFRTALSLRREVVNQMKRAQMFQDRLDIHERAARQRAAGGSQPTGDMPDSGDPDVAELGGTATRGRNRAAPPPDMAGFDRDGDSAAPDYLTWFRRGRN